MLENANNVNVSKSEQKSPGGGGGICFNAVVYGTILNSEHDTLHHILLHNVNRFNIKKNIIRNPFFSLV